MPIRLGLLGLLAGLASACGGATAEAPSSGRPAAARALPLPRVVSKLPRWLAPGAPLALSGWTGAGERVTLLVGRRRLGGGQSGRLGRFRLQIGAPAPGRYPIAVETHGSRLRLGVLEVRPVVLAAVGDVTFGGRVAEAVARYGPRHPWLSVAPLLRAADLATANLEGAVSAHGVAVPGKRYVYRGPPAALATAARFAGVDVFSVANNHSLDFGVDAFFDTLRGARAQGVATVGGGRDLVEARRPAVLRAGGLRVAWLGYSDVRPAGFTAGPGGPGTAPAWPELIAADVRAARRRADVVVVWFHWGIERSPLPSGRQRELARAALRAGAAVVLGAHPHVLQPVERSGRTLVAWSLGNFVFPAASPGTERTGVLLVRLDARGVRGYSFRPARISGVQPRLLRR